jgi:hypothetical protein
VLKGNVTSEVYKEKKQSTGIKRLFVGGIQEGMKLCFIFMLKQKYILGTLTEYDLDRYFAKV